jgi:hypothetical protein
VRHDLGDLAEGEIVVLTLADAGILDEKGQLADGPDQLVDVLSMQEKARRKAQRAATKTAKPLWEEDGKVRGLLDKYDEEEEEAAAAFDAAGQLQAQQRREEELWTAGKALLDPASGPASGGLPASSDYYTAEEAAAMKGSGKEKKKKKKRKLRTTKVSADEDADAAAGLDLDALEAAAADGAADLGSREAREQRRTHGEAARAAAQADRAARFEAALGRANIASEALRPSKAAAGAADEGSDEADDELAVSLARARRLAQKAAGGSGTDAAAAGGSEAAAADGDDGGSSLEGIAKQLAKKREEDEVKLREQIAAGMF